MKWHTGEKLHDCQDHKDMTDSEKTLIKSTPHVLDSLREHMMQK